jgi:hypothetical protein
MTVRIHFAGLVPGRPLVHIAWAAFAGDERLASTTVVHFGREAADVFGRHWSVASTIADCDVVIYPHTYEDGPETATVAAAARSAAKPCLFFSQDERLPPSQLAYGTLYRSSIFVKLPHERCHPVFITDVRSETGGGFPETLDRESDPRIGFCGYVGTPFGRAVLRLLGARQKVDGLACRARVLDALASDPRIRCEFILRGSYLGAATFAAFDRSHPLAGAREAFLRNLFTAPYALAMRGKGNHSVRFYEILAAGRVPVFVNTGCVLPFEDEIDWNALTVWIEDAEVPSIGDRVLDFHRRTDADAFTELQRRVRRVWETRLTPEPWFRHVLEVVASGARAP